MASTAVQAQGTTLQVDDSTPGTADTAVANFRSFSIDPAEAPDIDKSNLSSTKREYYVGLSGSGTFSCEWDNDYSDAGQDAIRAAEGDSSAEKTFLLTLPNAETISFSGYVKAAGAASGAVDGKLEGGCSVIIDGDLTYA